MFWFNKHFQFIHGLVIGPAHSKTGITILLFDLVNWSISHNHRVWQEHSHPVKKYFRLEEYHRNTPNVLTDRQICLFN